MTKTQFRKKIASMKQDINSYIDRETLRLFESGGVDPDSFENSYALPKIILFVTLQNLGKQYRPLTYDKELKNLQYF